MSGCFLLDGEEPIDVIVGDGVIVGVGAGTETPGDPILYDQRFVLDDAERIDGRGCTLLPGLWDHHVHLLALAAALDSVRVGPPEVNSEAEFAAALAVAADRVGRDSRNGWIRAVGYHESVAGPLDTRALDRLRLDVPVRIQHRSGAAWIVNGPGAQRLGLDLADHPGIERDDSGRATGRIFGADGWIRERLGPATPPDLEPVGSLLARHGVVGATDMTPSEDRGDFELLASAAAGAALPQQVMVSGGPGLAAAHIPSPLARGPVKLLLADHDLPAFDDLVDAISAAHETGRPVAVHSVTRASLVLLDAAMDEAGALPGDRIEHASVVPTEMLDTLCRKGLTVVTQPNFVAERGDQYVDQVGTDDWSDLYRCGSLLAAGIDVAGGTDAPFGDADPWRAMSAAVSRMTPRGLVVGHDERIGARRSLELFLGTPERPGGPPRGISPGEAADLCVVEGRPVELLADLTTERVVATVVAGRVVHTRA